jgi:hypothetical protein
MLGQMKTAVVQEAVSRSQVCCMEPTTKPLLLAASRMHCRNGGGLLLQGNQAVLAAAVVWEAASRGQACCRGLTTKPLLLAASRMHCRNGEELLLQVLPIVLAALLLVLAAAVAQRPVRSSQAYCMGLTTKLRLPAASRTLCGSGGRLAAAAMVVGWKQVPAALLVVVGWALSDLLQVRHNECTGYTSFQPLWTVLAAQQAFSICSAMHDVSPWLDCRLQPDPHLMCAAPCNPCLHLLPA